MSANLDLYERIKAKDKDAFVEFLREYVLPWFRRWVGGRSGANLLADLQDLEQDLILRLLEWYATVVSLPKTLDALRAFCFKVGKNLFVDLLRHEAARPWGQGESDVQALQAASCQHTAWKSLIADMRAISLAGVNANVVHAYGVFVDLAECDMDWPSTRAFAARLGVSPSRASKLKTSIQAWLRAHLASG